MAKGIAIKYNTSVAMAVKIDNKAIPAKNQNSFSLSAYSFGNDILKRLFKWKY